MSMKSKTLIKGELKEKLANALKNDSGDAFADALSEYAMELQDNLMNDYKAYQRTQDVNILASRGIRQLTAEEKTFYKAYAEAVKLGDIKMAFEGIEAGYPRSVVEEITGDIRTEFPLLNEIDFQMSTVITRYLYNKKGVQLASWGAFGSAITKKLEGAFNSVDIESNKLAAIVPVSMDYIEAGPEWLDIYVRAILVESIGSALCYAAAWGSGKGEPIGMCRNISETANVVGGVYPEKAPVIITDLSAETLGVLFAELAKDENGRARKMGDVILLVNPVDRYSKIFPALAVMDGNGNTIEKPPLPVKIIEEPQIPDGKAILGIGKRYFMPVCFGGKTGDISFDDSTAYDEDMRVYKNKILGDGRPKDNTSFIVLDIENLQPFAFEINVSSRTKFKVRLKVAPKTVAKVELTNASGSTVEGITVNLATGVVNIPPLSAGSYTVKVSADNYNTVEEEFVVDNAIVDLGTIAISKTSSP